MDRRQFLGLSAAVMLAAGCARTPEPAASGASGKPAGSKAIIGLTYIPNVQFSPAYLAVARKAFGEQPVELRHHGAQEGLFTALASGQEHFVIAGGDEAAQAISQGQDIVAVSTYYAQHPARVIARSDAGIATLADLRGKKIGVPGRYGESWFGLLVALQTAGLKESDVTIQEIGYTAAAAMSGKKVDAIVGFTNNDTVQLRRSGLAVTELAVAPEVPLVGVCLLTTKKYLAEHRDVVKAVRDGIVRGMADTAAEPDAALDATKTWVPGLSEAARLDAARATLEATVPLLKTPSTGKVDGRIDPAAFDRQSEFMLSHKLIEKAVPASQACVTDL